MTRLFFFIFVILFSELALNAQDLKPNDSIILFKLTLLQKNGKTPIAGQYLKIYEKEANKYYELISNDSGACKPLLLPAEKTIQFIFDSYLGEIKQDFKIPDVSNNQNICSLDLKVSISNELDISFKSNSFDLDTSFYPNIDSLFNWLNENKHLSIEIRGHTDNIGSPSSNLLLSKNRAESVRKYLIGKGVNPSRIISKGLGETMPIEDNGTEKGRAKNRRTEVIVTN